MNNTNDEKKYCIYRHVFPNGKCYVGKTCKIAKDRWKNNGNGYLSKDKNGKYNQSLMARAINKYGWNNISHEILFNNLNAQEAARMEQICIALFRSNDRRYGYNLTNGGDGTCGHICSDEAKKKMSIVKIGTNNPMYGKHHSAESKDKISKNQIGKVVSDESKQKMSESQKGKHTADKNGMYGKHHTTESKKKMSDAHTGKKLAESTKEKLRECQSGYKNNMSRPVYCEDLNLLFLTIQDAAIYIDVNVSSISRCCRNITKTCGGYHWRYATEEEIQQYKITNGIEVLQK